MSEKHSLASRARWANITPEERTKRMAHASRGRWDKDENKDPKKRRALALKMVKAREAKKKNG